MIRGFPLCLLIGIFLISCSTQKGHQKLSFFFDGVPEHGKSAQSRSNSRQAAAKPTKQTENSSNQSLVYSHPPYKEQNCNECHKPGNMTRTPLHQLEICSGCHDDFRSRLKVLHGPVASGNCSACHNPHYAANKKLLRREGRELCLYCHDDKKMALMPVHRQTSAKKCTECHDPHGGNDLSLLK